MSEKTDKVSLAAGLYFVATPLGNARDITLRALDVLGAADVLAAEDTRSLRRLMEIHGVPVGGRKILPYHDHNGPAQRPKLLAAVRDGRSVAYVSDAGSPLIADPGFVLARDAIAEGVHVESVPGPAAVIAALSVAGLPTDRFTFAGFPPQAKGARTTFLKELADAPGTLILYESPKRVAATLLAMAEVFGAERRAALCRELTKKFEEVRRGTLAELSESVADRPPKGEIVLCIAAPDKTAVPDEETLRAALRDAMKSARLKDAARDVAERFGVSRRDVYQLGLSLED